MSFFFKFKSICFGYREMDGWRVNLPTYLPTLKLACCIFCIYLIFVVPINLVFCGADWLGLLKGGLFCFKFKFQQWVVLVSLPLRVRKDRTGQDTIVVLVPYSKNGMEWNVRNSCFFFFLFL